MKWLYTFQVNRDIEIEETIEKKNDKGEDVKETKKVKKTRPVQVKIRKPSRKMFDDGELYYGVKLSEGIKAGLLTRAQLAKRYDNDGGALSDPERERYSEVYLALFEKENQLQRYQRNLEKMSEEEKKDKISELLVEMAELRRELQEFETAQSALFDQTAENRAKNKTIMWWVLQLAHIEKNNDEYKDYHWYNEEIKEGEEPKKPDFQSLFDGKETEEKLEQYDNLEESEDLFWNETIKKLAYFLSYWYTGQAETEEDFKKVEEYLVKEEADEFDEEEAGEAVEEKTPEGVTKKKEEKPEQKKEKEVILAPEKPKAEVKTQKIEKPKVEKTENKQEPSPNKQESQPT